MFDIVELLEVRLEKEKRSVGARKQVGLSANLSFPRLRPSLDPNRRGNKAWLRNGGSANGGKYHCRSLGDS